MKRTFIIHTDGGARGNPGPAAIGVVIEEDGRILEAFGRSVGDRLTNNQSEYLAVEAALERAKQLGGQVLEVLVDSELITRQLGGEYKVKDRELGKIFLRIWNLRQGFERVTFTAVPREDNAAADRLVNDALDAAGF